MDDGFLQAGAYACELFHGAGCAPFYDPYLSWVLLLSLGVLALGLLVIAAQEALDF